MRAMFGCPVYKGLVAVEAGGLITLGEAPYISETPMDAFAVGKELPGVTIDLLPLNKLPMPINVCGSRVAGVQHGSMKLRGLNNCTFRVGLVCGRLNGELLVFGRMVSLEESAYENAALCEGLEQLLVQLSGPWLMQLLLTARPSGIVGIAVIRLEELWQRLGWRRIGLSCQEDLCNNPSVRTFCLQELR